MAQITDILEYYVNLLIIQYHNQPKAQATIRLIAAELLASGILLDIQNAYSVDTAEGVQLDIIGKYVGVDRYYSELDLEDYFCLITYDEVDALPSSPPRWGLSDYSTFDNYEYNGTLVYDDIIAQNNALFDSDYRILIRLKIVQNNSNYSHQQIDADMFAFFGIAIRPESTGGMHMVYFITNALSPVIQAAVIKKLLPKPMGVGMLTVSDIRGLMFAFCDYSDYTLPYGYGFSEYSDYDTLPGQCLIYSQITQG